MQFQCPNPTSNVEAKLSLHRQRLQCYALIRSPDEYVSAEAGGDGYFRRRTDVFASEHPSIVVCAGKHPPNDGTASCHAYVDADRGHRAGVSLFGLTGMLSLKIATHVLLRP